MNEKLNEFLQTIKSEPKLEKYVNKLFGMICGGIYGYAYYKSHKTCNKLLFITRNPMIPTIKAITKKGGMDQYTTFLRIWASMNKADSYSTNIIEHSDFPSEEVINEQEINYPHNGSLIRSVLGILINGKPETCLTISNLTHNNTTVNDYICCIGALIMKSFSQTDALNMTKIKYLLKYHNLLDIYDDSKSKLTSRNITKTLRLTLPRVEKISTFVDLYKELKNIKKPRRDNMTNCTFLGMMGGLQLGFTAFGAINSDKRVQELLYGIVQALFL